jgi:hypothetical protein
MNDTDKLRSSFARAERLVGGGMSILTRQMYQPRQNRSKIPKTNSITLICEK